MSNPIIEQFG